jgi:DNA-binding IclR family transcriptional regulator
VLGTVAKAGRVLELFTPEHPEWGVSEVATNLGIGKSGAHALLAALAETGLVRRTPQGRYRLGWRILSLSHTLIESSEFSQEAYRRMMRIVNRFGGSTMHLAVLDGSDIVYLAKAENRVSEPINVSGFGKKLPAHCTSVGKVLLAARGPEYVAGVAEERGLARFTQATITSLDKLQRNLMHVREDGYAYDLQEGLAGLCCVGAPIHDPSGMVCAAMSISVRMHFYRRNPDVYRLVAQTAAADLSRVLGYVGDDEPVEATLRAGRSPRL